MRAMTAWGAAQFPAQSQPELYNEHRGGLSRNFCKVLKGQILNEILCNYQDYGKNMTTFQACFFMGSCQYFRRTRSEGYGFLTMTLQKSPKNDPSPYMHCAQPCLNSRSSIVTQAHVESTLHPKPLLCTCCQEARSGHTSHGATYWIRGSICARPRCPRR